MVYLILVIFFRSHIFLFRKSAFLPLKTSKMSKNGCFVVIRWQVGENFVSENDILRCIFRSKNIVFVPFAVRHFDSKVLVFLFLNTVKWFRQEINAYHGDLLQNERRDLKHFSNLHNEKSRFWSVFQVYKIKKSFLKHISSLQKETTRVFTKLNNEATRFWSVFQV